MAEKKYKRSLFVNIIYTLAVISGLITFMLFFYPAISDAWNRYVASRLISEYITDLEEQKDYTEIRKAAEKYNQELFLKGNNHISEYTLKLFGDSGCVEKQSGEILNPDTYYESMLNIWNDQMMGYLEIPSIQVSLPVYHYTSEAVLSKGIGHLYGSSLPVGGMNTHAVLTGHSGLMNARIFTDLEKLKKGDVFTMHSLDFSHDYQVDQIKKVLPDELEDLSIHEGKDEMTLVTCTPYGINTHRLLVRGHRIPDQADQEQEVQPATQIQEVIHFPFFILGAGGVILMIGIVMISRIWRKEPVK